MIPAPNRITDRPSAIPGYDDWPSYLKTHPRYLAHAASAQELADALGVPGLPEIPEIRVEEELTHDGVTSSRLSWQLGFGPRTHAWFIRPAGTTDPLPGVLALHCHAGIKSSGADRLVGYPLLEHRSGAAAEYAAAEHGVAEHSAAEDTADSATARITAMQGKLYAGRPLATWLASRGFAVLAHDAFCWGSRGFDLDTPPWRTADAVEARRALWREAGVEPSPAEVYDAAAAAHEDTVAKAAGLFGTSLAGMVAHDDLSALGVLASLPGVDAGRLGCLGFSGGGGRSVILAALSPLIRSHVVTCMMSTFDSLIPSHLDAHSWLLQTPGIRGLGEWPELTGRSSAKSLLVQYALADELFPEQGMLDADAILRTVHSERRYTGSFWPGGHVFTTAMQDEAADFLTRELGAEPAKEHANRPGPGTSVPRVALVGVHGYGSRHLGNLERLRKLGAVELVAVADPRPPESGTLADSVRVFASLEDLLAAGTAPDVVIVATPIQTHAPLALSAIAAGADVYVEKPPVASMAQFEQVLAAAENSGRLVQVGFQSLGSYGLPAIAELLASGEIGEVRGVSATGPWVRTRGYFKRSRWAGKRSLDGTDVVDGVATNALAHAVATGLRIAGATRVEDVASIETDLYRARATESDDTSVIRVRTSTGTTLTCALTLCASAQSAPSVTVFGTLGRAEFFYTEDRLVVTTADGERSRVFDRVDLLENLLEVRARREAGSEGGRSSNDSSGLLSSLAGAGAYSAVLEAVRTAEPPREIGSAYVHWEGGAMQRGVTYGPSQRQTWALSDPALSSWSGHPMDAHPVVQGIEQLIRRAALSHSTFWELGAPWARPPADGAGHTTSFSLGDRAVATWRDGSTVSPSSAPRPYLHPVTTLAGTIVTDHIPEDHVWHLGAGVAIQDVDGANFWGGRTYTRDAGAYVWRPDHGRIECVSAEQSEGRRSETLRWLGPDGGPILQEQRNWSWYLAGPSAWRLTLDFELTPSGAAPVQLGSPGSKGRPQGGYGGFFWRLPAVAGASVWTSDADGEDAVHGTAAPWLAYSGDFGSSRPGSGPATLVFLAAPQAPDPWFVRMSGYPGVGLSLAWDAPAVASQQNPLRRTVSVLIADGLLATKDIEQLITTLGETA